MTGAAALEELGVLTNVIKEGKKELLACRERVTPNSPFLVSPWCMRAMKDKLLPETLGATLPRLLCPAWRGPEKTPTSPHKAIHSAWGVFLAKHDSSSVSKVASGERSLHQCEMQNDLIQAAASVWIETITSDIRRSAFFSCYSQRPW